MNPADALTAAFEEIETQKAAVRHLAAMERQALHERDEALRDLAAALDEHAAISAYADELRTSREGYVTLARACIRRLNPDGTIEVSAAELAAAATGNIAAVHGDDGSLWIAVGASGCVCDASEHLTGGAGTSCKCPSDLCHHGVGDG